MKNKLTLIAILFCTGLFITSCVDDEATIFAPEPTLPAELANYSEPATAGSFWIDQSRFHVTDAGATLGRVLFYDKALSRTNTISCASCHLQEKAFADTEAFSKGIGDQVLTRNTPPIINMYDDFFYFWDGRVETLDELALKPVRNHKEMGLADPEFMLAKVGSTSYYPDLFKAAFGDDKVTEDRVADAIAQFLSSMISGTQ